MTNLPGLIYCYRTPKFVSLVILQRYYKSLFLQINCVPLFKCIWPIEMFLIQGSYKKVGLVKLQWIIILVKDCSYSAIIFY